MLGQVLKYKDGRPVGPDIATWARAELEKNRGVLTKWMADDSSIADHWSGSDAAVGTFLTKWQADHPEDVAKWKAANPGVDIAPKDLAGLFLASYAKGDAATWPETNGDDLQSAFFERVVGGSSRYGSSARTGRHGNGIGLGVGSAHHTR